MKQIVYMFSMLLCMSAALMAGEAPNQNAGGIYGFESILLGTTFDKVDAYMQAKFADNDILTKTDSIKKKRFIMMENYALSGNAAFKIDVILSFDRNDAFFMCDMEGPDRRSDPKLLLTDETYFLDMLKRNYGGNYKKETIGGLSYYRWSLGTGQIILATIHGKEFQFVKVSIADLALSNKQDEYEKSGRKE